MRARKRKLPFVVMAFFLLGCLGGNPLPLPAAEETLTIGLATPVSGRGADWGRMHKQGATMAVDEINAAGGIRGVKFNLIIEDDKADPKEAATVAKKFTANPDVKVVVGFITTPSCFASGPIYQKANLPIIISYASNPEVSKQGNYIFQNSLTQLDESPGAAHYAVNLLQAKKVAFIHINDDWGTFVRGIFPKEVEKLGGTMAAVEAYSPGEVDFRNLLIKIKNIGTDVIYGAYHPAEASQLVIQAKEVGISAPIYFSSGALTYSFIKLAGPAGEGTVFCTGFDPSDPDPIVQKFVKDFKAKYNNEVPTSVSSYVYDSVYLVAEAVKNTKGKVTRDTLRDGLENLRDVQRISGKLTPNEHRRFGPRKILYVMVKDGAFQFHKSK